VSTQSYIIGKTFNIAVVSIVVDSSEFFGYEKGIYVEGCCAQEEEPHYGANYWKDREIKINIEMYEPNNTLAFNQAAGCTVFGGFSKIHPMKSVAIKANKKFGKKKFEYPIFPDLDIKKYKSFRSEE